MSKDTVSFHYVSPGQMYVIEFLIYGLSRHWTSSTAADRHIWISTTTISKLSATSVPSILAYIAYLGFEVSAILAESSGNFRKISVKATLQNFRKVKIVIRPPGTLVPKALCFTCDVFFSSPGYLRAPSADQHETLPHDRNTGVLFRSKSSGDPPTKEVGGQKHAQFGAISGNFKLRSRISPERVKISKIGKTSDHHLFLPRSTKKARWTLVH